MSDNDFVAPEKLQVIIPYSTFEKMVDAVQEIDGIRKQIRRIDEQYTAIRGMFAECLEVVREIKSFVQD